MFYLVTYVTRATRLALAYSKRSDYALPQSRDLNIRDASLNPRANCEFSIVSILLRVVEVEVNGKSTRSSKVLVVRCIFVR